MNQIYLNLRVVFSTTLLLMSLSYQVHSFCGDSRVVFENAPAIPLEKIYSAFKANQFTEAARLIKPIIVALLRKDFVIPKIELDLDTDSANPGIYKDSIKSLIIYPRAWAKLARSNLLQPQDLLPTLFIVFVHELVHAWQAQNTNLLSISPRSDNSFIYEGHAVFVQSIIADIYDLTHYNKTGLELLTSPQFHRNLEFPEVAASFMKYTRLDGCRFFAELTKKDVEERCFVELSKNPPRETIPRHYILNPTRYWPQVKQFLCPR